MRSYRTLNGVRASADVHLAPRPKIEGAPGESLCELQLAPPDAAILAKGASVFVGAPLGNRALFDRIKLALKFGEHHLEPLAQCGIDHRGGQAFGAGDFGKEHIDVRHDFHKCGALAPRNRSTNKNTQIATKERTKIPPHARKVGAKLVVMMSSGSRLSFEARPYVGAHNSPWSQRPVFSDFIGSTSATNVW